jgi:hypothetical protein
MGHDTTDHIVDIEVGQEGILGESIIRIYCHRYTRRTRRVEIEYMITGIDILGEYIFAVVF